MTTILRAAEVGFVHRSTGTVALHPTDLHIAAGETVALVGSSGAGKSTLAEIALGLRRPSSGHVLLSGEVFNAPRRSPRAEQRHRVQGVGQDAAASLPPRTPISTTIRRALARLAPGCDHQRRITSAAERARIPRDLLDRAPRDLSGGQGQRAAIARALALEPDLVVADEPTSALDPDTAGQVADALLDIASAGDRSLLLVTHDTALAARCDRILTVAQGRLTSSV